MNAVSLNRDGFTVLGEKKILLCASLFYFRIPREDWQRRMQDLRACGYNCIDVYFPWNFHELHPDDWCFEGMHDCAAFLDLAAENNLYVIARPGPYICSEWDGGALPAWLGDVCSVIRQNDPDYLRYLSRWLRRILPIIAAHEAGKGGSVVAVQLENEMDFFACGEPEAYMAKLESLAREIGITVPLIACAGECDIQGAGGTAGQMRPSFNVYCPDNFPFLECQLAHMRRLAAERNTPLLITETNREHALLKRELLSGARLMSPYNQVGGTDTEMTNGISNWASDPRRPLALMATDYDFHSMITVDGRMRAEALQGRLMGRLIASLGELLAGAKPVPCPVQVQCDFSPARFLAPDGAETDFFPALETDAGFLFGVTNTGSRPGRLTFRVQDEILSSGVRASQTRIFPFRFSLESWGIPALIQWSEAEMCSIEANENGVSVLFLGSPEERICLRYEGEDHLITGEARIGRLLLRVTGEEQAAREAFAPLPDLRGAVPSDIHTEPVPQLLRHAFSVAEQSVPAGGDFRPMEDYGVYRGDVFYHLRQEAAASLLLTDPADFVWLSGGGFHASFFGDGSARLLENVPAGEVSIRVQSWGHVNFDDVRQPSLKMGSKKGISGCYRVNGVQDLTDLWLIYPDAKYAVQRNPALKSADRILATSINSWSYPASPMKADFTRPIRLQTDSDAWFLYVENPVAEISASVNGAAPVHFRPGDSFVRLNIPEGPEGFPGGASLQLTVARHFSHDSLGRILLYHCSALLCTGVSAFPVESWQRLSAPEDAGDAVSLPLTLSAGEECILTGLTADDAPRGGTLLVDGAGLELTLCTQGHVIGRIQLKTDGYPEVRGGSSRRIYVPESWKTKDLLLHVSVLGDTGSLDRLCWETVTG